MLLGAGIPQDVEQWALGVASFKRLGTHRLNDSRTRAWKDGFDCIWRQNGVWDFDDSGAPQLLRSDHFARVNGKPVDFSRDYYRPFANRFAAAMQAVHPNALIFLETEQDNPISKWGKDDATGIVYAPHWYDAYVLVKKAFIPFLGIDNLARKLVIGQPAIRRSYPPPACQSSKVMQRASWVVCHLSWESLASHLTWKGKKPIKLGISAPK